MKCYLFCAGGCGSRVLEAIVHLCASGLGPGEIKVLMIDSDASGGNLDVTNDMMNSYHGCQSVYGNKMGDEQFFRTRFSLFAVDDGAGAAGAWSPVNAAQQFHQVLGYGNLKPEQQQVANLFFTDAERKMPMNFGFLGHPAVGAAALSLLPLYGGGPPWGTVAAELTADLASGFVNVVIAGSVFGGTGASVFFPLANWLRRVAGASAANLKIGAVALVPYFSFPPPDGAAAAAGVAGAVPGPAGPDARKFPLATRAAAQFYNQMRSIGAWPFSAMFWLGDDTPVALNYCPGGKGQNNPPHFIELLGAQAVLDFYAGSPAQNCCYYAGSHGAKANIVGWADIPRLNGSDGPVQQKRQILKFLASGLMHSDFYAELFRGGPQAARIQPALIPWYRDLFIRPRVDLTAPPHVDHLNSLSAYFARHVGWWEGLHSTTAGRLELLNPGTFEIVSGVVHLKRDRLKNMEHPDNPNRHGDGGTEFHELSCSKASLKGITGATAGAPTYLAVLAGASSRFVKRHYGV